MSIFAPIFRPTKSHKPSVSEAVKSARKRKREAGASEEDVDQDAQLSTASSPSLESAAHDAKTAFQHPVKRTDPYFVAGHSREEPLPPTPFPHAAVKNIDTQQAVASDLAALNPPLYVPGVTSDDPNTSLKRRHIDNLTTLLHTCMLRGDWERAARAWGLLLRVEVDGRGMDVRQYGRWGIGAELLLRRGAKGQSLLSKQATSPFTNEGFRLARDYYERLILQYPHTPRNQYGINALTFYPALFSVWIYEVEDRSRRARQANTPDDHASFNDIRRNELQEAKAIAQRLDDLLMTPPYDTAVPLLELRGMVGLWLSDLHTTLAEPLGGGDEDSKDDIHSDDGEAQRQREEAQHQKQKALHYLQKAKARGVGLQESVTSLLKLQAETEPMERGYNLRSQVEDY
ncbi:hypothetical protein BAUCODRAFT_114218 [Baudoinia panamericana UAMH 10762]|uniref:Transcription factor domain-containing protein n=1 Tax=Baudoinia panamericana (strain UAMH 10762) TaxID=717646 RepID=M2MQD1_BAUPA|nr:uncharacterized protein BAUCODRAFT_114218 [Baudoinia panamericana UAMH 10762]EMC93688.1 hypothetical protein BAUCODRAFT_114218 [Baudoinia panamericana UAMH 10762]